MAEVRSPTASGESIMPPAGAMGQFVTAPFADGIVNEARLRFQRCAEWESAFRPRYINDIKFANGDSDNGWQWPNEIRRNREVEAKPCLTMNVITQHNKQITNMMRKNKSQIKVLAQGNAATANAAATWSGIIHYVESSSNAQEAYANARQTQVDGGYGVWRIVTKYVDENSFDQDPQIVPVWDPLSVYFDPDCASFDGIGSNFAFVFDDVLLEEWHSAYPEIADLVGTTPMGLAAGDDDWLTKDHIRVCEYFRKVSYHDTLISYAAMGERKTLLKSQTPDNIWKRLMEEPTSRTRPTARFVVEWYLIAGDRVVDSTTWLGDDIPLIRCLGERSVVEGILDIWGHTRKIKDAQRMYNYNASAQVEFVALQGKTPWIAPAKAIEEFESMWNTANVANHSVLIWNHVDDENPDKDIPPPFRADPPNFSPAYQSGMDTAFNQMMMVSGQWQNQMGMMGNERTGAAIGKRQEQGDTATYHFQDHYETSLRTTGAMLINIIPRLWDTQRVMTIQNSRGEDMELVVDPQQREALQQEMQANGQIARMIFNPRIGRYAIAPSVGPAYGTKREEAQEKLGLLITQAPEFASIIGDLLVKEFDFDGAQEAAQRIRRLVPPQALGEGPTQNEQALGAKSAALTNALSTSLNRNAKQELKLVGKEEMRNIDAYEAQTKRMVGLKEELPMDKAGLQQIIQQLVQDSMGARLAPIFGANADELDLETSPMAGAKRGVDGNWYTKHPTAPGKYLKIERKAA